jgi:hypothetical protein
LDTLALSLDFDFGCKGEQYMRILEDSDPTQFDERTFLGFLATSCHSTSSVSSIAVTEGESRRWGMRERMSKNEEMYKQLKRETERDRERGQRGGTFVFEGQAFVDLVRVVIELLTENVYLL